MSDIAFSVIVNNNGIDDIVFKTIMLKGDKGNSVDHVEKTSTSGLVDTYTIYLTDGTIGGTFTVTNGAPVNIDDTVTAIDKTWSSSKLSGMIKSIDDNVVSADKLWSSQKINSMLAQTGTIEDVAIASFSDGADDVPLSELTVDIEAWQEGSGEPSHDNERAIHGWNECNIIKSNTNLWDELWEIGDISSTTGEKTSGATTIRTKNYIPVKPNSVCFSNITLRTRWYDAQKNYIGSEPTITQNSTFVVPNNAYYLMFTTQSSYGTTYNNDISINYPATDHDYHAHDGGVDTIEFGQTIFGGKHNILTGLMTVTHAIVDLGSLTWISEDDIVSGQARVPSDYVIPLRTKYNQTPICTTFLGVLPKSYNAFNNGEIGFSNSENLPFLRARTPLFIGKTNAEIKALMNGVMFVYELATSFDIDLTPTEVRTLLNANNIYADTGNVDKIVYFKTGSEAVARMIEAYMRAQPEE